MTDNDAFDEVLRDRFRDLGGRHTPESVDPGTVADRILARPTSGGTNGSSPSGGPATPGATGAAKGALWKMLGGLTIAALAGVGVGAWAGSSGSGSAGTNAAGVTGDLPTAQIWRCPDSGEVGHLTSGDRILLTGRSEDRAWARLRDPHDLEANVWVSSAAVDADRDIESLPVVECDDPTANPDILALGATVGSTVVPQDDPGDPIEETTTTTAPEDTTTTADPQPTPGPNPTPTPSPDRPDGPTTTTTAPDRAGPVITNLVASPTKITTIDGPGLHCEGELAIKTTTISATISDPSGVNSVRLGWSVNGHTGSTNMTPSDGRWKATIGQFPYLTIPINTSAPIQVTVTATDRANNTSKSQTTITLQSSADCLF